MKPFTIDVIDLTAARRTADATTVGTYFAFTDRLDTGTGRLGRLLARPAKARAVHPLVGGPIELPGLRLVPADRGVEPLACLVCDRDLYRAEQDTACVFVAIPSAPADAEIVLEMHGAPIARRRLSLGASGVAIEPFPMLLAGQYSAHLSIDGRRQQASASFAVAQYSLAPLTAKLASHALDRTSNALRFALDVESYQVALDRPVRVALVENGREVSTARVAPSAPGRFAGQLAIAGGGAALRLRVTLEDDAARVAEVAIPGSRKSERDVTLVSELGREVLLSLMPEPDALPVRGAYLSHGDVLSTPLVVERVDAHPGVIHARAAVESLTLVILDLATGRYAVREIGDVAAGAEIPVDTGAPVASVFAGGWVGGQPFEGMTGFFRPVTTTLSVRVPASIEPGGELPIAIACGAPREVPVLVCVRDQRLTATDTPESSLAASAKRGIAAASDGMAQAGLEPLTKSMPRREVDTGVFSMPPPGASMRASAPLPRGMLGSARALFTRGGDESEEVSAMFEADGAAMSALSSATSRDRSIVVASASKPAAPPAPARAVFPEVLFYGLVDVAGERTLSIPIGDSLGTFAVEAFALDAGDWTKAGASFVVDKAVRADLDVPPAVHPEDDVTATFRGASRHGRVRLSLARDGQPVALTPAAAEYESPATVTFACRPGRYTATVTDVATAAADTMEVEVGTPGRFRSLVRELALLQAGERITLDSANALTLRVLPAIDEKVSVLVEATADYGHLCCEQTAAKILSAAVMYLTSEAPAGRRKAESIILAGIAREKTMWRRGAGFAMYPDHREAHSYYGRLTVRYLWTLASLSKAKDLPAALAAAIREGTEMADDAARALRVERVPASVTSIEDAWAASGGGPAPAARARRFVDDTIDFTPADPRPRERLDAVRTRALFAYGGAVLLAAGDVARGLRLANVVLRQFTEQGRLYSTVDSIAAIALMTALRAAGIVSGGGRVTVNGEAMDVKAAAARGDGIETIEVLSGVVPVEVTRVVEEDWSRFSSDLAVKIGFRDGAGAKATRFEPGDRVDLRVELPKGYRAGDLVHVALPAALSWMTGGGRVKKFSMDFEGRTEIAVPLIVTGAHARRQRFAVCVRNMFEEERAASPGVLTIG